MLAAARLRPGPGCRPSFASHRVAARDVPVGRNSARPRRKHRAVADLCSQVLSTVDPRDSLQSSGQASRRSPLRYDYGRLRWTSSREDCARLARLIARRGRGALNCPRLWHHAHDIARLGRGASSAARGRKCPTPCASACASMASPRRAPAAAPCGASSATATVVDASARELRLGHSGVPRPRTRRESRTSRRRCRRFVGGDFARGRLRPAAWTAKTGDLLRERRWLDRFAPLAALCDRRARQGGRLDFDDAGPE